MLDGFTTTMREHVADCYQARGLSSAGSEQLANNQTPTKPSDQAMVGTKTTVFPETCYMVDKNNTTREIPCKSSAQGPSAQSAALGQTKTAGSTQGAAKGPAAAARQAATVAQAAASRQGAAGGQAAVSGQGSNGGNTQGGDKTYDKWVNKTVNW